MPVSQAQSDLKNKSKGKRHFTSTIATNPNFLREARAQWFSTAMEAVCHFCPDLLRILVSYPPSPPLRAGIAREHHLIHMIGKCLENL